MTTHFLGGFNGAGWYAYATDSLAKGNPVTLPPPLSTNPNLDVAATNNSWRTPPSTASYRLAGASPWKAWRTLIVSRPSKTPLPRSVWRKTRRCRCGVCCLLLYSAVSCGAYCDGWRVRGGKWGGGLHCPSRVDGCTGECGFTRPPEYGQCSDNL